MSTGLSNLYDYTVKRFVLANNSLQPQTVSPERICALEIELQSNNHWWIKVPADYHDSFYHTRFDPTRAIPTQVTGAVGEALALVVMDKLYGAMNIRRITPHPSSQSADFEMDITQGGIRTHALVESKGSNAVLNNPPMQTVWQGLAQLLATRCIRPGCAGYLIITSYPAKACHVIKVF